MKRKPGNPKARAGRYDSQVNVPDVVRILRRDDALLARGFGIIAGQFWAWFLIEHSADGGRAEVTCL